MEMTRKKALKIIADSQNVGELSGFFGHKNKHVRHAARVKAYRVEPGNKIAADEIERCRDEFVMHQKKLMEARAWNAGDNSPKRQLPEIERSIDWTVSYVHRQGVRELFVRGLGRSWGTSPV